MGSLNYAPPKNKDDNKEPKSRELMDNKIPVSDLEHLPPKNKDNS